MQPDSLTPANSPLAMQRAAARDRQIQNATLARIESHLRTIGVLLLALSLEGMTLLCFVVWKAGHGG